MGALQDNVSLLAAGLDLALVQSLVSAMRTADLSRLPPSQNVPAATTVSSQPAATSLANHHTALRYGDQPAATFHPQSAHGALPKVRDLLPYICTRPVEVVRHDSTIQPPWKVLPWPKAVGHGATHYRQQVKILPNRDDVTVAGRLLDLFV